MPRHAFLEFINNGVMGSMFTHKSHAVNLDWTTTFTPELPRVIRSRPRGRAQDEHADAGDGGDAGSDPGPFGAGQLQRTRDVSAGDFAATIETVALAGGLKLKSENVPVATGLETEAARTCLLRRGRGWLLFAAGWDGRGATTYPMETARAAALTPTSGLQQRHICSPTRRDRECCGHRLAAHHRTPSAPKALNVRRLA